MLKNNSKAFSLIEVLVAKSIIFILLATFIPIYTTITFERAVLKDRIAITSVLHDTLQMKIWQNDVLEKKRILINGETVQFNITNEHNFIKVCASWENKQKRREVNCLYGLENK